MMPLELLTPGERGEITEIHHCGGCGGGCHSHGHQHGQGHHHRKSTATRAEEMGLRVGKQVEVLNNEGNLLLLLVDEARIAIDRRMARSIKVKGISA
ncbi:MAG: ferrous iron transport protein A [Trichlorobacter sp.]|uniref:FeoA domain-containing protein n=1 Tax=Trichlorobacter sp. TaxID=2911007 RepID=UPI0025648CFC|nr:FeoA domain-containing protein [Trichlorobacter sp.]MDK9719164.1 ferrous iron transport protein A [Trichlorobacter sp.]